MCKSEIHLRDSSLLAPLLLFLNQYFNTVIQEYYLLWVACVSVSLFNTYFPDWFLIHFLRRQLQKIVLPASTAVCEMDKVCNAQQFSVLDLGHRRPNFVQRQGLCRDLRLLWCIPVQNQSGQTSKPDPRQPEWKHTNRWSTFSFHGFQL